MSFVYFAAKAYPVLFVIPMLKMPIVNSIATRVVEKVFIDMPLFLMGRTLSYTCQTISFMFDKKKVAKNNLTFAVYPEEEFSEWENIEMINYKEV
jgi:hypothetical protein